MKVLMCAHRWWGEKSCYFFQSIYNCPILTQSSHSTADLERKCRENNYQVIILAGWNRMVPDWICDNFFVACLHPSDLPEYAGGTPIQHQVLDGIVDTQMTLFKVTSDLDSGPIIDKEPISLRGNVDVIYSSMASASGKLIERLVERFPDVSLTPQKPTKIRKRLTPEDCEIKNIHSMTCKEIYNFIRCRTDPYPNVYMEDETGRVIFKDVGFEPGHKNG